MVGVSTGAGRRASKGKLCQNINGIPIPRTWQAMVLGGHSD